METNSHKPCSDAGANRRVVRRKTLRRSRRMAETVAREKRAAGHSDVSVSRVTATDWAVVWTVNPRDREVSGMSARKTIDLVVTLVDFRDRTVTTTRYPGARAADAERIGRNYRDGWNERGQAAYGDGFRSFADGFRVHDDTGRILAYG